MAEKEVLAGAIAGWLVLKGIHSYGRWQSSRQEIAEEAKKKGIKDLAGKLGLDPEHYLQGLARNRFLVFSIGTALSISAGALASLACQETFKLLRAP